MLSEKTVTLFIKAGTTGKILQFLSCKIFRTNEGLIQRKCEETGIKKQTHGFIAPNNCTISSATVLWLQQLQCSVMQVLWGI